MEVKEVEWFTLYYNNKVDNESNDTWIIIVREPLHSIGCDECTTTWETSFWEYKEEIQSWIILLSSALIISLLITLCLCLVYKYKKDKHPFKHAIKKSWPWWIVIFIISIVMLYLWVHVDWVYYLF